MTKRVTILVAALRPYVLAAGLLCIVALTVPELPFARLHWAEIILWSCVAFYVCEWALRNFHPPAADEKRPTLFSYAALSDAIVILPVPIAYFLGVPPQMLTSVIVVFLFVLFIAAVAMHLAERDAQPVAFGTLPNALYWAVTTLSTTGYGDVVPATGIGRVIASVVMICGLAVFGLWTGILANGFAAETRRRDFTRTWEFVARVPFFKPLDPGAIIEIARMLRPQEVAERTAIIRRDRHGDSMYFIASGQVEIAGTNPKVLLGEGAFFGELALMGDGIRTATVIATTPTTLLVLEMSDYRIFAARHPELARAVEVEGARRLAEIRASRATAQTTIPHNIPAGADGAGTD